MVDVFSVFFHHFFASFFLNAIFCGFAENWKLRLLNQQLVVWVIQRINERLEEEVSFSWDPFEDFPPFKGYMQANSLSILPVCGFHHISMLAEVWTNAPWQGWHGLYFKGSRYEENAPWVLLTWEMKRVFDVFSGGWALGRGVFFPSFFWCRVDRQRFLLLLPPVKRSESNVSAGRCPKHFDHFFLPHKRKESLLKMSHDKHPESMCQNVQKTPRG